MQDPEMLPYGGEWYKDLRILAIASNVGITTRHCDLVAKSNLESARTKRKRDVEKMAVCKKAKGESVD